jgi:hypothetical protein
LNRHGIRVDRERERVRDHPVTRFVRRGRDEPPEGPHRARVDAQPEFLVQLAGERLRGGLAGFRLAAGLHERRGSLLAHDEDPPGLVVDDGGAHVDVRHGRTPFPG